MRPSNRMRLRTSTPLREAIGDELLRPERIVLEAGRSGAPSRPEARPRPETPLRPEASPPPRANGSRGTESSTPPATAKPTVRTLDAVELLSSQRGRLTAALERVRTATRVRPVETAMERRLAELRALPQTPPRPGPGGWVAARIVGLSADRSKRMPLPGVTVELRSDADEEEPERGSTDPLGSVLLKAPAHGIAGATLNVVSATGRPVVTQALQGDSISLLVEVPYDSSLEAAFTAGQRFFTALAEAEAETKRLEQRLVAERQSDENVFRVNIDAVERTLRTVVERRGDE